jgi:hypothetical protein
MQPKQRLNYAKQSKLCLNCLEIFSNYHPCSKQMCKECHKRYHTLLHIDKQEQTSNKGSTENHNQCASTKGTTIAEVNTYCSLKGKATNHILLATAIVEIQNKSAQYIPCRALLDSGSQSHFIT